MEHCYCYNFTKQNGKPSKIPYQGCKLFKIKLKEFGNFDDFNIRCVIDHGSAEFDLQLEGFEECKDIKTDKAWFKLLHLLFGFLREYDVNKIIEDDIKRHSRYYPNYAEGAKSALYEYIELLRTGIYSGAYKHGKFYEKMSVEELVYLLKEELLYRTAIYQDPNSKKVVVVEITDYYYDYDALYKEYGIDPEDDSSESYINFSNYITTSKQTKLLKKKQIMYAEMWGD